MSVRRALCLCNVGEQGKEKPQLKRLFQSAFFRALAQWILLQKGFANGPALLHALWPLWGFAMSSSRLRAPKEVSLRKPIHQFFLQIYLTLGPFVCHIAPANIPGSVTFGATLS